MMGGVVDHVHHDLPERRLPRVGATCATVASMLSQDVVVVSDGGGNTAAALPPIFGADKASRFLTALSRKGAGDATGVRVMDVNGEPALVPEARDTVITGSDSSHNAPSLLDDCFRMTTGLIAAPD